MVDWLSAWVNNIAGYAFWPLIILTIICGAIGFHSWDTREHKKMEYGSPEYGAATWRMFACAQGVIVGWIIYALLAAVPAPNYNIVTKVKTVEKIIKADTKYEEAFQTCYDQQAQYKTSEEAGKNCETVALLLARPDLNVIHITKRVPGPVVVKKQYFRVTKYLQPTYNTVYKMCMNDMNGTDSNEDRANSQVCHNNATFAVQQARGKNPRYWYWPKKSQ